MYEIMLTGTARERGLQQGRVFRNLMLELLTQCPVWLGDMPHDRVAMIRDMMVRSLRKLCPEMVEELEGIAEGAGMGFDDVCTLNFVSAIGALNGCTNVIALKTEEGPVLAKTSDIGNDYAYYSIQHVKPDSGYSYFAVSWSGCLWAEVGINSAGLAAGQGSAPTMPGQRGEGIPTLEYPRVILQRCSTVAEAIDFCEDVPMAGKGLNIALVDSTGQAAVVEKSGTRCAVRYPLARGNRSTVLGTVVDGLYCANHFLEPEMQGMIPLAIPGLPSLTENSQKRLENVARFFQKTPSPGVRELISLLNTSIEEGGLCQDIYPELTTHYSYLVLPLKREIRIGQGTPCHEFTFSSHRL